MQQDHQSSTTLQKTVVDLFIEQAFKCPEAIAVRYKESTLTYKELDRLSNKVAAYLLSIGIAKFNKVPIILDYSENIPAIILGILKIGASFVPLDIEFPKDRIEYVLQDCDCSVLISDVADKKNLTFPGYNVISIQEIMNYEDFKSTVSASKKTSANDLVYVIYTSGSTGKPKGVLIEHRQLMAYLTDVYEAFTLEVCCSFAILGTFSADAGYTAVFGAICYGKTLHIINLKSYASFKELSAYFDKYPIDCFKTTPSIASLLLENEGVQNVLAKKRMIIGGEACSNPLAVKLHKQLPEGCLLFNHYGPTETTIGVLGYKFPKETNDIPEKIPLGKPFGQVTVHILNDQLQPTQKGEKGEIYIGGALVGRGYLNNPDTTAEKFIEISFSGELQRVYKTGDFGVLNAEGNIEYLGRLDEQIKINGNRIELKEIESVALLSNFISQCAVVKQENKLGASYLVAYITTNPGYDDNEFKTYLKCKLPTYMVPNHIVVLAELPLTVNNKVHKLALPNVFIEEEIGINNADIAEDTVYLYLHTLWQELLGLKNFGEKDQFFDLGGNSFLLIKLAFRINSEYNVGINALDILNHLSLGKLNVFLKGKIELSAPKEQKIDDNFDPTEASTGQKGFYIRNRLNPTDPFPNSNITFKISGNLNSELLNSAFLTVIKKHEALHTSFRLRKTRLFKIYEDVNHAEIQFIDGHHDINLAVAEATKPFNLGQVPIIRLYIIKLLNGHAYLHIDMPHINSDGQTLQVFIRDLVTAYNTGNLQVDYQFSDYQKGIYWYRNSKDYISDKKYWSQEMKNYHPLRFFNLAFPGVNRQGTGGYSHIEYLSSNVFDKIAPFLSGRNMSRFQFFFISWAIFVSYYLDTEFLPVLLPVANRNSDGFDEIIGLLSNITLVNFEIDHQKSIESVYKNAQRKIIEVLQHQQFPLAEIVELLDLDGIAKVDHPSLYFGYHQITPEYKLGEGELSFYLCKRDRENLPLSIAIYDIKDNICLRITSQLYFYERDELENISKSYFETVDRILSMNSSCELKTVFQNLKYEDIRSVFAKK